MIAILQPFIPHYREEFFNKLNADFEIDVFTIIKNDKIVLKGFNKSSIEIKHLKNFNIGPILIYNPLIFFKRKYETLVLMGSVKHVSTWFILIINIILRKKIILWGHGISIKRYEKEKLRQPWPRKLLYKMADYAWFYTENELKIWQKEIPKLEGCHLNNTISGIDQIIDNPLPDDNQKKLLKQKHNITTKINLIICARFTNPHRKGELLINMLNQLNPEIFGLIVIGNGYLKPDFSEFVNVYDYGAVYDNNLKNELFSIADIYVQPAWLGLSVTEAMAHGLPVFSLTRSKITHQCVEYNYLKNGFNAIIRDTINELAIEITNISDNELNKLKSNAKQFAKENLSMNVMVTNATNSLQKVNS